MARPLAPFASLEARGASGASGPSVANGGKGAREIGAALGRPVIFVWLTNPDTPEGSQARLSPSGHAFQTPTTPGVKKTSVLKLNADFVNPLVFFTPGFARSSKIK